MSGVIGSISFRILFSVIPIGQCTSASAQAETSQSEKVRLLNQYRDSQEGTFTLPNGGKKEIEALSSMYDREINKNTRMIAFIVRIFDEWGENTRTYNMYHLMRFKESKSKWICLKKKNGPDW